jgi:predicted PurR-regulated permease PerM
VAIPAAIAQFLAGKYAAGTVILAGYFIIVSNLDLLIRSKLVSLQTYGSFALMILSLLGGYHLFGFFGIFYGPILMVLFLTMLDVYQTHFAPLANTLLPLPAVTAPPREDEV